MYGNWNRIFHCTTVSMRNFIGWEFAWYKQRFLPHLLSSLYTFIQYACVYVCIQAICIYVCLLLYNCICILPVKIILLDEELILGWKNESGFSLLVIIFFLCLLQNLAEINLLTCKYLVRLKFFSHQLDITAFYIPK